MRTLKLFLCALTASLMTMPAFALECANSGAAPLTAPDDTGDGEATACGHAAQAAGSASTALGASASAPMISSTALGNSANSGGDYSTALGYSATSIGLFSIAQGATASSPGEKSAALGFSALSGGNNSIALGNDTSSAGVSSVALGDIASSPGNSSSALGHSALSSGVVSTAVGYDASASGIGSLALGRFASSVADDSIALGRSSSATGARSIALGHLAFADQPDTVIIGSIPGINGATLNNNVGMGTRNPQEAVDVERSGAAARFQLTSYTDDATQAPQYIQRRARGTRLVPTALQNNDNLGLFSFRGYNGTAMGGSRATITAQAAGTFSDSSTPTRLIFATTPVGQTTPQSVLVITPDGKVQVNGVNLNVPDYVFEDDYELMPLEKLRTFIDANGHLPGIPSAEKVKSEGLDLAGSQMGLLQKVEELTLYTLQQESRLQEQQQRIERLEAMLMEALATNN